MSEYTDDPTNYPNQYKQDIAKLEERNRELKRGNNELTDRLEIVRESLSIWQKASKKWEKEAKQLREEIKELRNGQQGACYCCEPVGILNQQLEAKVKELEETIDEAAHVPCLRCEKLEAQKKEMKDDLSMSKNLHRIACNDNVDILVSLNQYKEWALARWVDQEMWDAMEEHLESGEPI